MRSSEPVRRALGVLALCALAACASAPPESAKATDVAVSSSNCPGVGEAASAQQSAEAQALRSATERGPAFATLRAASPVQSCSVRYEPGAIEIEWRMRDGGWLKVVRDARIELYSQEVRLVTPPTEDASAWLKRAASAAFGEGGCGIDWSRAESDTPSGEPGATEQVFRGDSCNCQARLRRDSAQRAVGATLRRAC
jgi:hypothetical protein